MKNKMSKGAILEMPLVNFNIGPLNLWVTRPGRRYSEDLRKRTRGLTGDALLEATRQVDDDHRERMQKQPMIVGQLIEKFKYWFPGSKHSEYGRLVRLGDEPVRELKEKLMKLGLTPDDWPALVPHDEILENLSKANIMDVPVREFFQSRRRYNDSLHRYLGCTPEEVVNKTIRDLLRIDPFNIPNIDGSCYDNGERYFRRHKRLFVALRQQLVKKGFTIRDGAFFNWNPTARAFKKAQKVLRNYSLTPSEIRKFAKIVVAERWVV